MAFCARTAPAAGQRRPHEDALALASGSWLLTSSDTKGALCQSGQGALLWQGQVSNLSELRKALDSAGTLVPQGDQRAVLLAALDRWGASSLAMVQGQWSFLYCDRRRGRLLAARDLRGGESLFYRYDGVTLAFSDSLEGLRKSGPLEPNGEALASFLIRGDLPPGSTFYKDIWELEPGYLLEADLRKRTFTVKPWKRLSAAPWSRWDQDTARQIEDQCRQALAEQLEGLPGPLAVPVEDLAGAWLASEAHRAGRQVTALVRDRWGLEAAMALGLPRRILKTSPVELLFSLEDLVTEAARPLASPCLSRRKLLLEAAREGETLWDPLGGAGLLTAPQHWFRGQLVQMVLAGDFWELSYSWDHLQDRFLKGRPWKEGPLWSLYSPESIAMALKFRLPRLNLNRKVLEGLEGLDFLRRERRDLAASCGAQTAFPFADSSALAEIMLGASPVYRIHGGDGQGLLQRLVSALPPSLIARAPEPSAAAGPEWKALKIFPAVLLRWVPAEMERWISMKVLRKRWKDLALRRGPEGLAALWRIASAGLWLRTNFPGLEEKASTGKALLRLVKGG